MPGLPVPSRGDFPVTWPVATRWADNDHYGHANNAAYYSYIDTAVNAWLMSATGTDVRELPAIGIVVSSRCDYLAPIGFPDVLEVGLAVARVGRTSIRYRLALFVEGDPAVTAVAEFVHVYVDRDERRPVPVPDVVRAAVATLPLLAP